MPTTTASKNGRAETLLQRHTRLVKSVATLTGAPLASMRRQIGDVEYLMIRDDGLVPDKDFSPYVKPATMQRSWDKTPEQLKEAHERAIQIRDDENMPDIYRERASKDAEKLEQQAEKRQVTL